MNGTIYLRESPSKRRYVGQTVKKEEVRWRKHVTSANNPKSSEWKTPLSACIRKYGGDSFTVKILETGIQTQEELDAREQYWIKELHTLIYEKQGGLNVTIGGTGYRKYGNIDFQGYYDQGYSIGEISEMTGVNPSTVSEHIQSTRQENCRRCRERALKKNPPRAISNYDMKTLEKVSSFPSAAEAALFYFGVRDTSCVTRSIYGPSSYSGGYFWKYDDQPMDVIYDQYERHYHPKRRTNGIAVVNVETGEEYRSALQAAKAIGVKQHLIISCCEGWRENAGEYHWRYKDKEQAQYKGKHAKPIVCVDTGVIYPSTSEASKQTGIRRDKITDCLKKRRDDADGFHWVYKNPEDIDPGIFRHSHFKRVLHKETGVIYESMSDAAQKLNVNVGTISRWLKNGQSFKGDIHLEYYTE